MFDAIHSNLEIDAKKDYKISPLVFEINPIICEKSCILDGDLKQTAFNNQYC